jgi:Heterokaryon incompatibility protein (HET)
VIMASSAESRCAHPDIRNFGDVRCCLSCGFAIVSVEDQKDNNSVSDITRKMDNHNSSPSIVQPYRYRKLNYELGQEIRLFVLQFDLYEEPLRCKILHSNLDDNPTFEAVSYTWANQNGVTSMSKYIVCQNGTRITISASCDAVLRRIRAKGSARTLWTDMICIDQNNIKERNHQVGIMDIVYTKAKTVIIDLGESDRESDFVFDGQVNS